MQPQIEKSTQIQCSEQSTIMLPHVEGEVTRIVMVKSKTGVHVATVISISAHKDNSGKYFEIPFVFGIDTAKPFRVGEKGHYTTYRLVDAETIAKKHVCGDFAIMKPTTGNKIYIDVNHDDGIRLLSFRVEDGVYIYVISIIDNPFVPAVEVKFYNRCCRGGSCDRQNIENTENTENTVKKIRSDSSICTTCSITHTTATYQSDEHPDKHPDTTLIDQLLCNGKALDFAYYIHKQVQQAISEVNFWRI